jgi:hypothetical protein
MTHKEKAQELVDKFMPHSTGNSNSNEAIKCAIISVDEILNEHNHFIQTEEHFLYWQQVKEALIKKQEQ